MNGDFQSSSDGLHVHEPWDEDTLTQGLACDILSFELQVTSADVSLRHSLEFLRLAEIKLLSTFEGSLAILRIRRAIASVKDALAAIE
jgi:hypothetical protein